ncbi:hypothetical protein ACP70R_008237 [Stipagrostis hirtigluma subsp. patula]
MARESVKAGMQKGKEDGSGIAKAEDNATAPGSGTKTEKMSYGTNGLGDCRDPAKEHKGDVNTRDVNQPQAGAGQAQQPIQLDEDASSRSWMQMAVEVQKLESAIGKKPTSTSSSAVVQAPTQSAPATSTNMGTDFCKSWISDMGKILDDTTLTTSVEWVRWKKPTIHRVPDWIKGNKTDCSAYEPDVVSLGPFHHGKAHLKPMEEHKRRLMLHMVKRSEKPLEAFVNAVAAVADVLQDTYDGIDQEWLDDKDRFVTMMVTDGGFLLEIMTLAPEYIPCEYDPYDDPVVGLHGILSLKPRIRSDMCLVENQLPLLVLQQLEGVRSGIFPEPIHTINLEPVLQQ